MFRELVLLCVVIVLNSLCDAEKKPYNFVPPNNHLDVNEGDEYFIGFDEISNETLFDYCYYHSDTISGNYPIPIPLDNSTDQENESLFLWTDFSTDKSRHLLGEFLPNNNRDTCAFKYKNVDEKSPLQWTLTAHDNITDKNFTEVVTISFFYNMPLYMDRIEILSSAGFVNFFQSGDTKFQNCSVAFNNEIVNLDLDNIKVYNEDSVLKSRLSSLGDGKCGYKVTSAQKGDPDMTLFATDVNNKTYRKQSTVAVLPSAEDLKNRTIEVYLGSSATVHCGKETDNAGDSDQKFCFLYNPKGELVLHDTWCTYELDIVTLDYLGIWRCTIGLKRAMDSLQFTTELVPIPSEKIESFTEDTPNYFVIGCKLVNFKSLWINYCMFTRPDGKQFKVTTGGATEYYNSFTSDLDNGRCALEIMKPLREEDKGTWKCEAKLNLENTGTFVDVEKTTTFNYSKAIVKNIHLGNDFIVDCMVPHMSDYCYIVAPNGTQYKPLHNFAIMSGECLFEVKKSTATDNGTWTCLIAQQNGLPDELITVDILIIELTVSYVNAEVPEGDEVVLTCNSNGIPLEYCRFVSPVGISYSLRKQDTTISTNITYVGRGLEYGECGIKISEVQYIHNGKWKCHISSGRYSYDGKVDLTREMLLTVTVATTYTMLAESVGIAAGVLVVIIATGGFIFYRYSKRRKIIAAAVQYAAGRSSGSSTGSGGERVLLQVQEGEVREGQITHRIPRGDTPQPQQV